MKNLELCLKKNTLKAMLSLYIAFRQTLNYAVEINLIPENPTLKTKAVSKDKNKAKGKYWTKEKLEKVLASISISSFYEELIYVTFFSFII